MTYPHLWEVVEGHPECYFQIITNGMFLNEANVERIRRAGNVTVLVSVDGNQENNDARRGQGTFEAAVEGLARLKRNKILFGVATTVTGENIDEVTNHAYVEDFISRGAIYLWYYVYRPVGPDPSPRFCVDREQMLELRRRLLKLRRKHPIILIDTYWNAAGEAVCACEQIGDNGGDLYKTINESRFLRGFQEFACDRTRGCVILEYPQELVGYLREHSAQDSSGRDAYGELEVSERRGSHHLPGEEIPEDYWVYRFLKKQLFFGMGGYG